jgi:hypothetical protein
MELNLPPGKRVLYPSENQDYQRQNLWQAWPEHLDGSFLSQNSTSNVIPAIEPLSDHPSPSLQEQLQGQQAVSHDLYHTNELLFYPDIQQFDFNASESAKYSQNAFDQVALATPNNDLAMESMLGRPSDAAKTSNVCFGTVCHQISPSTDQLSLTD